MTHGTVAWNVTFGTAIFRVLGNWDDYVRKNLVNPYTAKTPDMDKSLTTETKFLEKIIYPSRW